MASKVNYSKSTKFHADLNNRVNAYFTQNNLKRSGNWKLYLKTGILISAGIALYFLGVFGNLPFWSMITCFGLLGLTVAFIGFNVMHDGSHGSYSEKPWINRMMASTLDLMGGSSFLWNLKHNVNHHNFTNIEGHDDDIEVKPFFRSSEQQPKYWFHRYQFIYWIVLYGLSYFSWIYMKDFKKYFTGHIAPEAPMRKMSTNEHLKFWAGKAWYVFAFIIVPYNALGASNFFAAYATLAFCSGMILSVVFQLAHIVETSAFPAVAPERIDIEDEWAVHQLATTANFATRNRVLSWFVGGLNYQVEHHLFPRISHVHYPEVSQIVKEVCAEHNVPYYEYPTFFSALGSHVRYLKEVGA